MRVYVAKAAFRVVVPFPNVPILDSGAAQLSRIKIVHSQRRDLRGARSAATFDRQHFWHGFEVKGVALDCLT